MPSGYIPTYCHWKWHLHTCYKLVIRSEWVGPEREHIFVIYRLQKQIGE